MTQPVVPQDVVIVDGQDVLKQAPNPTHTEPTPWGLFTINPVINGKSVLKPARHELPAFQRIRR